MTNQQHTTFKMQKDAWLKTLQILAEKMMRDSWATGDDTAWKPGMAALLAHAAVPPQHNKQPGTEISFANRVMDNNGNLVHIAATTQQSAQLVGNSGNEDFERWWEEHGQFLRSGGGQYEKTFAFTAWQAARRQPVEVQRVPLTIEQIQRIYTRYGGNMMNCARSIERAHGIKPTGMEGDAVC